MLMASELASAPSTSAGVDPVKAFRRQHGKTQAQLQALRPGDPLYEEYHRLDREYRLLLRERQRQLRPPRLFKSARANLARDLNFKDIKALRAHLEPLADDHPDKMKWRNAARADDTRHTAIPSSQTSACPDDLAHQRWQRPHHFVRPEDPFQRPAASRRRRTNRKPRMLDTCSNGINSSATTRILGCRLRPRRMISGHAITSMAPEPLCTPLCTP